MRLDAFEKTVVNEIVKVIELEHETVVTIFSNLDNLEEEVETVIEDSSLAYS